MIRYRGIVIGCGQIGVLYEAVGSRPQPRSHASALASNPRTELAAFVGVDTAECQRAKRFFDVPTYTDITQCLREVRPDIAIVSTPTSTHTSIITLCAQHRVPIIIGEKPLASNAESGRQLSPALQEGGSVFALNYQRRLFPLFIRARDRLQAGELGTIRRVECSYDNGLYNNGGHAIDSVLFLLGQKIISVSATIQTVQTHPYDDPNIDGEATTDVGTHVTFKCFDRQTSPIHELRITGEKGTLRIADYGYTFEWGDTRGTVIEHEREEVSMTAGVLADAIDAYERKREPKSGLQNGIETLTVLDALRHSAAGGGRPMNVEVHS